MVSSVLSYLSKDNNRNGLYNIVSANYEGYPVQFGLIFSRPTTVESVLSVD